MKNKIKWTKKEKNLIRSIIENDHENKNGKNNINFLKRLLNPERDKSGIMIKMGRIRTKEFGLDPIYTRDTISIEK